ncbi:MAG: RDD family protein, partial [Candidatus Limnocylindria bacterium]
MALSLERPAVTVAAGRLEVETPDHVVLRYDLAGAGNRGFAALLDFVLAALITAGLLAAWQSFGLTAAPQLTGAVMLLTAFLGWSYFILLEWLWNGQTIGKRAFGLRVIGPDGSPARFGAVFVRNLVRVVDFLPGLYGFGVLAIVLTPGSQRLGDLAAGTYVVRAPRPRLDWLSLRTIGRADADRPGTARRPEVRGLSGEAQRLVREFVAREGALSPADRARVAAGIAPHLRSRFPD